MEEGIRKSQPLSPRYIKVLKCGFVDSGSGNQFPGPDWAISGRFPDPESANVGHFPHPELAFPDLMVVALSQMRQTAAHFEPCGPVPFGTYQVAGASQMGWSTYLGGEPG